MNVLITGAESGIGFAVRDELRRRRDTVYSIDISTGCDAGEDDRAFTLDVTDEGAMLALAGRLSEQRTELDAIVIAAGIHRMLSLAEDDFSQMRRLVEVNLVGAILTVRAFHKLLKPEGRIVIVTSEVAGVDPLPFNGLYSTSKVALEAYAKALRQELGLIGQRVITVRPGAVRTPLAHSSVEATRLLAERTVLYRKQAHKFSRIAASFMGEPISPEVIARVVLKALTSKSPRLTYTKHMNAGLWLLGILPTRLQCFIIRALLGKSREMERKGD